MALQDETREDPRVMEHLWSALPARTADAVGLRLEMARVVLALPPIAPPGSKHVYSNVGYALLGLLPVRAAGHGHGVRRRLAGLAGGGRTTTRPLRGVLDAAVHAARSVHPRGERSGSRTRATRERTCAA